MVREILAQHTLMFSSGRGYIVEPAWYSVENSVHECADGFSRFMKNHPRWLVFFLKWLICNFLCTYIACTCERESETFLNIVWIHLILSIFIFMTFFFNQTDHNFQYLTSCSWHRCWEVITRKFTRFFFLPCVIQYHFLFWLAYYWTNCLVQSEKDPYEVPKSIGIFRLLESPKDITTTSVAQRIMANHDAYVVISFLLLFSFLSEYLTNLWCLYSIFIWMVNCSD
jgi:hypothetical protein